MVHKRHAPSMLKPMRMSVGQPGTRFHTLTAAITLAQRYRTCVRELILSSISLNVEMRSHCRDGANEPGIRLTSSLLAGMPCAACHALVVLQMPISLPHVADQCKQLEDVLRASERINLAAPQ